MKTTDKQVELAKVAVAEYIVKRGGCVGLDCSGRNGVFSGAPCPFRGECASARKSVVGRAQDFLESTKN
jgi:hypothetical protein